MIRSHESMAWYCCGVEWPKHYRYCGFCGRSVLTADRVLLSFPTKTGQIAVVARGETDTRSWKFLAESIALTASTFEEHDAKKALESPAMDSLAGASVPAVDPSRSTPEKAVP